MLRPAGGTAPLAPSDLSIAPVHDGAGLMTMLRLAAESFGIESGTPEGEAPLLNARVLADTRFKVWIGRADGQPACAFAAFVEAGLNQVMIVATVPAAQRRGYGQAITWPATLADPALPAALITSDAGRPVYERMGYLPLLRTTLWYRDRP